MSLTLANLRQNPRRTLLTVFGLANAVIGGLVFYGFTRDTYWGLAESFARGGNGHLQIADADWFDSPAPEHHRTPREVLEAARQTVLTTLGPEVAATSLRRNIMGLAVVPDGRSGVFLGIGTEPDSLSIIAPLAGAKVGENLDSNTPFGVVLGSPLGDRLGLVSGSTFTVLVTTDQGMTNGQDFSVRGLTQTGSEELDRTFVTLPLDSALSLADSSAVDVLIVALGHTEATDFALAKLQAALPEALAVRPWYDRASYYVAVRALYDRIFGVFQGLMALVTILSLSHAVSAVVTERTAEITMLRVVGLRRSQVAGLFMAEGAVLGGLGVVCGGVGAVGVAALVQFWGGIPMPPPPGFTMGYAAQIRLDPVGFGVVMGVTFVASVLATVIPAWRATRGDLSRGLVR